MYPFQAGWSQWFPSDVSLLPQGEGDRGKRKVRAIISMFQEGGSCHVRRWQELQEQVKNSLTRNQWEMHIFIFWHHQPKYKKQFAEGSSLSNLDWAQVCGQLRWLVGNSDFPEGAARWSCGLQTALKTGVWLVFEQDKQSGSVYTGWVQSKWGKS